jgi:hypothetical protein
MDSPSKLKTRTDALALLFEQGAPPQPPLQQRLNALARLRRGETDLTRRDWILVTWGLCDDCGADGKPMEQQPLFDAVMGHTDGWIERRDVPRKGWFGLLNSYFSYDVDEPSGNGNWLRLRGRLADTMPILTASLKRPKLWSRMLEEHHDILTDDAGRSLRQVLFYGSTADHEQLNNGLPIPESSWLWRRVVALQIDHLNTMSEAELARAMPPMVDFLRVKPIYADEILAALLTRYCQSGQREETNELLKSESFSRWGNPQLRRATRWAKVAAPVRAMVLRWFAKDDLEHFFSLLQGDGQVDQARLKYWLRFVGQISYTRILLGPDAMTNRDPEFRNFREKNSSRCGQLTGGANHNNAFIMCINDQYFVEFSGTGNACYAYAEKELPFDPNAKALHSSLDLKRKIRDAEQRYAENRILHVGSWQWKADSFLAKRGIRSGDSMASAHVTVKNYEPDFAPPRKQPAVLPVVAPPVQKETTPTTRAPAAALFGAPPVRSVVKVASELARINRIKVQDNLDKGGAFWVLTSEHNSALGLELIRLGMTFNPGKGFWIK